MEVASSTSPTIEKESPTVPEESKSFGGVTEEIPVEESTKGSEDVVESPVMDDEKKDGSQEAIEVKPEEAPKEDPGVKKDEAKKNETPDVLCLQLDEGDNLDGYLEKERARQKEKELLETKMKEECQVEEKEVKENLEKKTKPVKKPKSVVVPKKKPLLKVVAAKKIKSKVVEATKKPDEKLPSKDENKDDSKELLKDNKIPKDDDKNEAQDENKEQVPEVSVKSVIVKCDKDKDKEKDKDKDKDKEKEKDPKFLWVSNITRSTKANDLKTHFTPHGKVLTARIVTDGKNYYGYLVMERKEDVENCIKTLDGTVFENQKIRLSEKGPERRKPANNGDRNKEKPEPAKKSSSRRLSGSRDPLTLKVRDVQSAEKCLKFELIREKRSEERRETIRRQKEAERAREEKRKERIKYEERKAQEVRLEREKRKLEHERHVIERERMNLLRLQKRLADTERSLIQRQKQELERDIKDLEYKKRKSVESYDRKPKTPRLEESRSKEYWKERSSPKAYEESYKKDGLLVPPPPVLTESYHQKSEKERSWDTKKEYSSDRKDQESRYSYGDRNDYQDRYKDRYKEKDKTYPWPGYSSSSTESWRQDSGRNIPRHTVNFPVQNSTYEVPSTPGYYQGTGYRKSTDYYYRGPDRKY